MPYFAVIARDKPGMIETRKKLRPDHRARLRKHDHPAVTVRIGGPLLDDDGEMIGTMLVIEADTRDQVVRYIDDDPYQRGGVYRSVEITPFAWGLTQLEDAHG